MCEEEERKDVLGKERTAQIVEAMSKDEDYRRKAPSRPWSLELGYDASCKLGKVWTLTLLALAAHF